MLNVIVSYICVFSILSMLNVEYNCMFNVCVCNMLACLIRFLRLKCFNVEFVSVSNMFLCKKNYVFILLCLLCFVLNKFCVKYVIT